MGKNKRAAKAARAAAAAASRQQPLTTSPATPLDTPVTPAASAATRDSREPALASTEQQHDVHAQNACPTPSTSSAASHMTTTSSNSAAASSSSITRARSATACEPERPPVAQPRDTREVHRAGVHPAAQPASTASNTRSATSPDVPTAPSRTTRAFAAENEPAGLVRARNDDVRDASMSRAPPAASLASSKRPTTPGHVPTPAHRDEKPPTPGFEPGEPQTAAATEPPDDPTPLDTSQVNELVATALRKGYDAGLKEGRNTGFREGLQAGRRTGVESGKELGYEEGRAVGLKEGREQGRFEVSTTSRVASVVQPDDISPHRVAHATSPTDNASAVSCRAPKSTPAPADHASPSSRLATTLDAVDSRLLQEVRGASYDRGYDAGYHDGASDTFENLEWRLDEREVEGYSRGKEDGLRTLSNEQCAARKEIETTRYWEGFGQAQQLYGARATLPAPEHADAGTQTPMPPAVSCVDADAQTDAPPLHVDAASQATHDTHVDNAIDETRENHKNNSSRCDASTTTISDMHDSTSADVHHCNSSISTVNTPTAPTSFSWADDADALPIPSVPPLPMQRDFSILRSSTTTSPFGSLQRRARRAHRPNWRPPQRSWSRPVVEPALVVTRRHPAGLRAGRPFVTQVSTPTSCSAALSGPLEWDHDPRLLELSRVLQSLGWVRS